MLAATLHPKNRLQKAQHFAAGLACTVDHGLAGVCGLEVIEPAGKDQHWSEPSTDAQPTSNANPATAAMLRVPMRNPPCLFVIPEV